MQYWPIEIPPPTMPYPLYGNNLQKEFLLPAAPFSAARAKKRTMAHWPLVCGSAEQELNCPMRATL